MCWACFKKYTDKPVLNERVAAAYELMRDKDSDSSSLLHVIVADMNLDDCWFELDNPELHMLRYDYETAEQWERDIFDALRALSEEERATAVAMEWGYILPDGSFRPDMAIVGAK